jgi:hypothetical protein
VQYDMLKIAPKKGDAILYLPVPAPPSPLPSPLLRFAPFCSASLPTPSSRRVVLRCFLVFFAVWFSCLSFPLQCSHSNQLVPSTTCGKRD